MIVLAIMGVLTLVAALCYQLTRTGKSSSVHGRWRRAAELLEVKFAHTKRGPIIRGKLDDLDVHISMFVRLRDGERTRFTRVIVDSGGRIRHARAMGEDGLEVLQRLLQRSSDRRILQLAKQIGATVSNGRVRWMTPDVAWEPAAFVKNVRRLMRAANLLIKDSGSVPDRLLANAQDPSVPKEERLAMAMALLDRFPNSSQARTASESMIKHPDARVRIAAARALGERGAAAIGTILRDHSLSASLREQALDELLDHHPPGIWEPVLGQALRSSSDDVVRTLLGRIQASAHPPARALLRKVAGDSQTPPSALSALARALGKIGDRNAGPVLVRLVYHADESVQREAAIALAYKGEPEQLPPLLSRISALPEGRMRNLCRAAVREIEARHGQALQAS